MRQGNSVMYQLQDTSLLRQAYFANGQWQTEGDGTIIVTNPSTGETIGSVPKASRSATKAAIEAVAAALPDWS
eukprot:gene36559-43567_t